MWYRWVRRGQFGLGRSDVTGCGNFGLGEFGFGGVGLDLAGMA